MGGVGGGGSMHASSGLILPLSNWHCTGYSISDQAPDVRDRSQKNDDEEFQKRNHTNHPKAATPSPTSYHHHSQKSKKAKTA